MKTKNTVYALLMVAVLFAGLVIAPAFSQAQTRNVARENRLRQLSDKLGDKINAFGALAQMMKAYFELGELAMKQGEFQKAISCYEEVLNREDKLMAYDVPDMMRKDLKRILTEIYTKIAKAYALSGDLDKAEQFLQSVLKRDDLEPQQKAKIHMDCAIFYRETDKIRKAEESLFKVIEINKKILEEAPDFDAAPIKVD